MKEKGVLKKWLKENGKNALGNILDTIGESTSIPFASKLIEGIGESLMDDPELTSEQKEQATEIIKMELRELEIIEENLTTRWVADVGSDSKLAKNARPLTLHFISLLLLSYFVTAYFGIYLPSEYTSLLIVIVPTVYGGYFALREFGKHSQRKNVK
jgi:hypothetical protein